MENNGEHPGPYISVPVDRWEGLKKERDGYRLLRDRMQTERDEARKKAQEGRESICPDCPHLHKEALNLVRVDRDEWRGLFKQEQKNAMDKSLENDRLASVVAALSKDLARAREALEGTIRKEWDDNSGIEWWTCCGVEVKGEHSCPVTNAISSPEAPSESAGKPCLDPEKMKGAEDGFPGSDYP